MDWNCCPSDSYSDSESLSHVMTRTSAPQALQWSTKGTHSAPRKQSAQSASHEHDLKTKVIRGLLLTANVNKTDERTVACLEAKSIMREVPWQSAQSKG